MTDNMVINGQMATHLSDFFRDENVSNDSVKTNDVTTDDLDALFNEVAHLEERAKEKNAIISDAKSKPNDVFAKTYSVNSDAITDSEVADSDMTSDDNGSTAETYLVNSESVDRNTETPLVSQFVSDVKVDSPTVVESKVDDKDLIKVFTVNNKVYWYDRDNLDDRSDHTIYELSEQEALNKGMHHSEIEGVVKKTYFTADELAKRDKKDGYTSGTTNAANVDSGMNLQEALPHTGDIPVPIPLASASMGLGTFLLAWLKKRKKKHQKRFMD